MLPDTATWLVTCACVEHRQAALQLYLSPFFVLFWSGFYRRCHVKSIVEPYKPVLYLPHVASSAAAVLPPATLVDCRYPTLIIGGLLTAGSTQVRCYIDCLTAPLWLGCNHSMHCHAADLQKQNINQCNINIMDNMSKCPTCSHPA